MNNPPLKRTVREADFSDYVRQQLDQQSAPLPRHVVQSLRTARVKALTQHPVKAAPGFPVWKPIASFATVMVLVGTVLYFNGYRPGDNFPDADMDAELLFSDEGFQFYEDLEFYRWLANNDL